MLLSVVKNVFKLIGKTVVYTYATVGIIITTVLGAGVLLKSNELNSGVDFICTSVEKVSDLAKNVQNVLPIMQNILPNLVK